MEEADKIVRKKLNYTNGCKLNLQDYLRVLEEPLGEEGELDFYYVGRKNTEFCVSFRRVPINFNLTTGKPATEKDAEEFIKLVE